MAASVDDESVEAALGELKDEILQILDEMKAQDVSILHVAGRTTLADYFVLCSGTSDRHCRAIASEVAQKLKKRGVLPINPMDGKSAAWTLLDYGNIILHVLSREARGHYRLEMLWNPAEKSADIPDLETGSELEPEPEPEPEA